MKTYVPNALALLCVVLSAPLARSTDIEEVRMAEFLSAYDSFDAGAIRTALDNLVTDGGTNAVRMLLPLADVTLIDILCHKRFPEKAGVTVNQQPIVYEALEKMNVPLEMNIAALTNSLSHPWLAKRIVQLGIMKHGESFTTSIVERAVTFGGQWGNAERYCIPLTTVATNAAWPVGVTLSQTTNGLSIAVTNFLSSTLSIPGPPLSLSRNTIRVFTDEQRPQRHKDFGSVYDHTLDNRPGDWFLSIPAHGGASFSVPWLDATNGIPASVWSQAWAVQWVLYDDMHHLFLSNPVSLP